MKQIIYLSLIIVTVFGISSCRQEKYNADTVKLVQLDSLLCLQPELVLDSLKNINPSKFSNYNKAYYQLLEIIAKDKNYFDFSSDSLINSTVDVLSHYRNEHPQNYARSLMYQGIVRYRMNITDSMAYQPLKDASKIYSTLNPPDLRNKYLCQYYIAEIFEKNNNTKFAKYYYIQAKQIALQLCDTNYIYSSYRNLFWCAMRKTNYVLAKTYIDTLSLYLNTEKDYILSFKNIQSAYLQLIGQHSKTIDLEKQILKIKDEPTYQNTLISNYFIISESFNKLNLPDSALKYAQLSIEAIQDTNSHLNYLYYEGFASAAEKSKSWKLSSSGYKKAYELLNHSLETNLDTKILELEKKYDLTLAENKVLQFKNHKIILIAVVLLMFLIVVVLSQHMIKQKQIKTLGDERNKVLENEKKLLYEKQQLLTNENKNKKQELIKKQMILTFFHQISKQNLDIKNFLFKLKTSKYISDNKNLYNKVLEEYENYNQKTNISETAIFTDDILIKLTGIKAEDIAKLNKSDKVLLILLALNAGNKEIALLLNTSADSVRNRKLKLKKKIEKVQVHINEQL